MARYESSGSNRRRPKFNKVEGQFLDDPMQDALWRTLSDQLSTVRSTRTPSYLNEVLLEQAHALGEVPLAAVLKLWAADSLAIEKRFHEALTQYKHVLNDFEDARFIEADITDSALKKIAVCHERLGETQQAIEAYKRFARRHGDDSAWAHYHAGRVAEEAGWADIALEGYDAAAQTTDSLKQNGFPIPELAVRDAKRLRNPSGGLCMGPEEAAKAVADALRKKDAGALRRLASPTHFSAGVAGGCCFFADRERLLERLVDDLRHTEIHTDTADLQGEGEKRYLDTRGWKGEWFTESVYFLITRSPQGWEWSGIVLLHPTPNWISEWEPEKKEKNQALPFGLAAPWPRDWSFMAGGLKQYIWQQVALLSMPPISRMFATILRSINPCGFGLRGFYYNFGPTHQGQDAFAIDFTRYRSGVPYDNESKGTDVLAVRTGVVATVHEVHITGSSFHDNHVYIQHEHEGVMRYESRYLHFTGPHRIRVSEHQYVDTGTVLGQMDNTGNSALHHLHFSIHDIDNSRMSVRPTPMAGERLHDQDGGKCIRSHTRPYRGWSFYETPPPPLEP